MVLDVQKALDFVSGENIDIVLRDTRIRDFDDEVQPVNDITEVVFESTNAQVDGRRAELEFFFLMDEESFNLISRALLRQFLIMNDKLFYSDEVRIGSFRGVVGKNHMVLHIDNCLIEMIKTCV